MATKPSWLERILGTDKPVALQPETPEAVAAFKLWLDGYLFRRPLQSLCPYHQWAITLITAALERGRFTASEGMGETRLVISDVDKCATCNPPVRLI